MIWTRRKSKNSTRRELVQHAETSVHLCSGSDGVVQQTDWYIVCVSLDSCADEHVCSVQDCEWVEVTPNRDPVW